MSEKSYYGASHMLLSLALLVIMCANISEGNVNCRKFVFAPICRGVAAKRSLEPIIQTRYLNENSRKVPDMDEIVALFATPPPSAVQRSANQEDFRELRKEYELRDQDSTPEQDLKPVDIFYDWYVNTWKRNNDMGTYNY